MAGWAALALLPAFGLDTLAVAIGLGAAGTPGRARVAIVMALFEGGMPLAGALVGTVLGRLVAGYAVWGAAVLLALLGLRAVADAWRELRSDDEDRGAVPRGREATGWRLLLVGVTVSGDEFAAGLAAGGAHLPLELLAPLLALQAALCTYAGLHAGAAVRRLAGRYGELAAGVALVLAAVVVAAQR